MVSFSKREGAESDRAGVCGEVFCQSEWGEQFSEYGADVGDGACAEWGGVFEFLRSEFGEHGERSEAASKASDRMIFDLTLHINLSSTRFALCRNATGASATSS